MNNQGNQLPHESPRITIVKGARGSYRARFVDSLLEGRSSSVSRVWNLPCCFEFGGPWAGIRELVSPLVTACAEDHRDLLHAHDYELARVVPRLRKSLGVQREGLTEVAPVNEKVRNYPADRALRLLHGLIDFIGEAKQGLEEDGWVLICDDFDRVGPLGRIFFTELLRRGMHSLNLMPFLLVETEQGLNDVFSPISKIEVLETNLPSGEPDREESPEALSRMANILEQEVQGDVIEEQQRLHELIRSWRLAGKPERALPWEVTALEVFNQLGIYEESVVYGERALESLKLYAPDDTALRWRILPKLFISYLALKHPEDAARLAEDERMAEVEDQERRAQVLFSLAMLHARFLSPRDYAKGERLLDEGLEALQRVEMSREDFTFFYVFNRNGLAMIRHFQGRPQDAIDLCEEGFRLLEERLSPDRHRLHRSVLIYNIAQVYSSIGDTETSIGYYTSAIQMDPKYSEYYNERGNLYLKMERFEEALDDYRTAISLSPPYPEVFANLGQCFRKLGRLEEGVKAYSRALELQPSMVLAYLGRAQCLDALEETDCALRDYTAALQLDPNQAEALANRAVLLFDRGDWDASRHDLDEAIERAPGLPQLYQNRSIVLAAMGRNREAIEDLRKYVTLDPDAEDKEETLHRLQALQHSSSLDRHTGVM